MKNGSSVNSCAMNTCWKSIATASCFVCLFVLHRSHKATINLSTFFFFNSERQLCIC